MILSSAQVLNMFFSDKSIEVYALTPPDKTNQRRYSNEYSHGCYEYVEVVKILYVFVNTKNKRISIEMRVENSVGGTGDLCISPSCLLNVVNFNPSPTLETPQNAGGNQGEGEGER